jgi:small-conductance mechanosensitive channel
VKVQDYTAAPGELYSAIMRNLAAANIEMPFPQREIRILSDPTPQNTTRLSTGI